MSEVPHVDVLIIGAGLSGIGAAHHLQTHCPDRTYAILEARDAIGGTWDLFRYPGIRSDSDMYTLGYAFRPWTQPKAIADGPSILAYIRDTAREGGIEGKVAFGHKTERAEWSSEDARWTVHGTAAGEAFSRTASFVYFCTGYYDYDQGYAPELPGIADFTGEVVHPQHWPEDLDHAGKKVVIIGSGATAMTLVPSLAEGAEHVTMLQRSPTYVVARPAKDPLAATVARLLPPKAAFAAMRWKAVLVQLGSYKLSKKAPDVMRKALTDRVRKALPEGYAIDPDFTPAYDPWDQRLCLVPDGDLFTSIRDGSASVVTDQIDTFTPAGVRLASGKELAADLVITATGLNMKLFGGAELVVDGDKVVVGETLAYKGVMLSGVPNLALATGYTNASWTLKVDLSSGYLCRLLNYMTAGGHVSATPEHPDPLSGAEPLLPLASGYVQRAAKDLPKQGRKAPWRVHQNYLRDLLIMRCSKIDDGVLRLR